MGDIRNSHLYALITCEASGDALGAGLMRAILRRDPQAKFIGIGGPKMIACGMISSFKMDSLSVMGLTEVVRHLIPILKIRHELIKILLEAKPCVVIGIDAPDFNLKVEKVLKQAGIPAVHYVSPSVWAWREGRIKTIKESTDMVLSLLPFEKEVYDRENMRCTYVGHTLASTIPLKNSVENARSSIALANTSIESIEGKKVMGILPGSRKSEIERMLPIFAKACSIIKSQMDNVCFICAATDKKKAYLIKDIWMSYAPFLSLTIYEGRSQDVIASSDAVLLTCGTVALEAMLLNRPMAVAYKVNMLSALIVKRMLKIDTFSLPNLLAKRNIVSEFIQSQCNAQNLANEMLKLLNSDNLLMKTEFNRIHQSIRMNSDEVAADAIFKLIDDLKDRQIALVDKDQGAKKKDLDVSIDANKTVSSQKEPTFSNDVEPTLNIPSDKALDLVADASKKEPDFKV